LHQVGDLFELNVKFRCPKFNNGTVDIGKKEHWVNIEKEREIDKEVRNIRAKNIGK